MKRAVIVLLYFSVYMVLLQLKENLHQSEFLLFIRSLPVAHALYLQLCRQQNRQLLRDLYEQEDNFVEEGSCRVWHSYQEEVCHIRQL